MDEELQQDPRKVLNDYLQKKMLERQDNSDLIAEQDAARERGGYIGALEGIGTIASSIANPGSAPVSYASARTANQQQLTDYLAQKKAEKDAEAERMGAAKVLADMQDEEMKGKTALQKAELSEKDQSWQRAFQEKKLASEERRAEENLGLRKETLGSKQQIQVTKDLLKYNVPVLESKLASIESTMSYDDNGAPVIPGFAYGIGGQAKLATRRKVGGFVPGVSPLNDTELANRTMFNGIANEELQSRSGAAVTEGEYRRFLEEIKAGSFGDFTPAQVARHMKTLKEQIALKKDAIRLQAPEAFDKMYSNAGSAPIAKTPAKRSSADIQKELDEINAKLGE
jgi:hypothetical protein